MNIFCIEGNYLVNKQEKEEHGSGNPGVFIKSSEALLPRGADFHYAHFDQCRLYVQSEIVLRISKKGHSITPEEAVLYYDALTTGINFTQIGNEDAYNGKIVPWEKVKAFVHSSIIGEWFPATQVTDIRDINFCLYNNREMVQIGNTELMIHDFNSIISSVSKMHTLEIGDIIFTGTPIGIGEVFSGDQLESFWEDDTAVEVSIT